MEDDHNSDFWNIDEDNDLDNITLVTYLVSHWVLRLNRMLTVCISMNQVFTHTIQKMDVE
jgi:hypothetical protein